MALNSSSQPLNSQEDPMEQEKTSNLLRIRVDLNEEQKKQQRTLENEVDDLESKRKYLKERLNYLNQEKKLLERHEKQRKLHMSALESEKNEEMISKDETTLIEKGDTSTLQGKAIATLTIASIFSEQDCQVQKACNALKEKLQNLAAAKDRMTEDNINYNHDLIHELMEGLNPLHEFKPKEIAMDEEVLAQYSQDCIEWMKYLQRIENWKKRAELVTLKMNRIDLFIQLSLDKMEQDLEIFLNESLNKHLELTLFNRIIDAITYLFKFSVHGSKIWILIVNHGVLDFFIKLINCEGMDLGILYKVTDFFREVTYCEKDNRKTNIDRAKIFHRWFQTGRGIVAIINLLQKSAILYDELNDSSSSSINDETNKTGVTNRHDSISSIKEQYYVVFNLLCTLWNLSRSNTLQIYIQNSLFIDSYHETLIQFPSILSKAFKEIPSVMHLHFEHMHMEELQRLILKICSNIYVEVPEYIIQWSKLNMERHLVEELGYGDLFFDSVFAFISFANSPYLKQTDAQALLCVLMINIFKPTTDTDKLIKSIQILSFILKE
jgi:hypothetical protein